MVASKNKLTKFVLKSNENKDKITYKVYMSDIDQYGYEPIEDTNGRFYFTINNINFYQSETDSNENYVFIPDGVENMELKVINDYESK